ncbi:MAG: hypothetical protein WC650_03465 [Candidatus Doudnabacteria bacterium]
MERTSFVIASVENGISAATLSAITGIIYTMAEKVEEALSPLTKCPIIWGIIPYLYNNEEPACTYSVSICKGVETPEALRLIHVDGALMSVAKVVDHYVSAQFPLEMIESNIRDIISDLTKQMP